MSESSEPEPTLSNLPIFGDNSPDESPTAGQALAGPTAPPRLTIATTRTSPTSIPSMNGPAATRRRAHLPPTAEAPATRGGPGAKTAAAGRVDWKLVSLFRTLASERLSNEISDRPHLTVEQQRSVAQDIVVRLLDDYDTQAMQGADEANLLSVDKRNDLVKATMDALFGLGRLQPLVDRTDIENIECYGCDNVWVELSNGRRERVDPVAENDAEFIDFLAFIASRSEVNERAFSPAHPMLHMRLDGGARLAASAWITPRPVVVIRLHRLMDYRLLDLAERGMLTRNQASFLSAAVRARKNIVVAGLFGAGKTTMARALAGEVPVWEKIATLETEYELQLHNMPGRHPHVIAWEARPGSGERGPDGRAAGEYTLDQILTDSFRFNLSRLFVGEVRGPEVLAMFKAMQGGAGSISTTHSDDALKAIGKLVTCAMEAGPRVTEQFAYRQVAEHIDLIVFVTLEVTGHDDEQATHRRYVSEIVAIEPGEKYGQIGYPADTHIYEPGPDGPAVPGVLNDEMQRLTRFGFDLEQYKAEGGRT